MIDSSKKETGFMHFCLESWQVGKQSDIKSPRDIGISVRGICGEVGEVIDVYKKRLRGDTGDHVSPHALILEIGDLLFYLYIFAFQCEIDEPEIAPDRIVIDSVLVNELDLFDCVAIYLIALLLLFI